MAVYAVYITFCLSFIRVHVMELCCSCYPKPFGCCFYTEWKSFFRKYSITVTELDSVKYVHVSEIFKK